MTPERIHAVEVSPLTSSERWHEGPPHLHPGHKQMASSITSYQGYEMPSEPPVSASALDPLPWRPFYLRRSVLAAFVAVFLAILVAIEVLAAVSDRNNGIVSASSDQHYLWTFGPTAFLTLVAGFWTRVDYQTKVVAPWLRMAKRPAHASRTVLLDYFSGLQYFVPFVALRNRDYATAITATVGLLIKVMIVVSTGLLTLSWTTVSHGSESVFIQDRFVDDGARLDGAGTISYYVMAGLVGGNLTYPEGISKNYAYQSVRSDFPAHAETRVSVDGYHAWLDCGPVDLIMTGSTPPDPRADGHGGGGPSMNLTLTSQGCNIERAHIQAPDTGVCHTSKDDGTAWNATDGPFCAPLVFARFQQVQCDGDTGDTGKRMLIMAGNYTTDFNYTTIVKDYTGQKKHPLEGTLHRSTQLLCVARHATVKLDMVRNGTEIRSLSQSPGTPNVTMNSVSPWAIMSAVRTSYTNPFFGGLAYGFGSFNLSQTPVEADPDMGTAIKLQLDVDNTSPTLLYDADFLQKLASGYWAQYAAVIAKQSLMEPASIMVPGSIVMDENRLVVRNWAAQWMAGMVSACLALACLLFLFVPSQGFLPCSPSTVSGVASLIVQSYDLTRSLQGLGSADEDALKHILKTSEFSSGLAYEEATNQSHYTILLNQLDSDGPPQPLPQVKSKQRQPTLLHPVSRVALCLLLAGLIVTLEVLLHKSGTEDGLGDVGDDTYIHYTWTTIPALVFGLLAMTFSSVDFRIRALAPYTTLKHTVSPAVFMTLDFLDMSIPRTLFTEIKLARFGAFAATMVLLIASFFTIFTSSLFQALSLPTSSAMTLQANSSFPGDPGLDGDVAKVANLLTSLILTSNLSYPKFTYDTLAFPEFLLTGEPPLEQHHYNTSTLSIQAVLPAVRGKMNCRAYDQSQIRLNHTKDYTIQYGVTNPLGVLITGEEECLTEKQLSKEDTKYNNLFSTFPNSTYFALGAVNLDYNSIGMTRGCSQYLYTWGKIDYSLDPAVQHIASMGCNMTFELVDVDVTFMGLDLDIDSQKSPPRIREETARTATTMTPPQDGGSPFYALAQSWTGSEQLDPFFAMLTSSPWAVALSDLGDPEADEVVRREIRHQHGIIVAQQLAGDRRPANATNATLTYPVAPGDNDAQRIYNATITDPTGRRRVVQDVLSTRILETLLALTLVLLIAGWVLMRDTAVLPSSPTTIASVAALIAGGNLLNYLPSNAALVDKSTVARQFPTGARIWLGWGRVPDEEDNGRNENGWSQFGIYAVADGEDTGGSGRGGSSHGSGTEKKKNKTKEYVRVTTGSGSDSDREGELDDLQARPVRTGAALFDKLVTRVWGFRRARG